jgi:hypothetical protein
MSLQPIDLQTLFVRLSQIGKEQANRKESAVLEQETRGKEMARQSKLQDETVNQTSEAQNEAKVKERQEGGSGGAPRERGGEEDQKRERRGEEKKKRNVFEDPALGKNIDISG